MEVDTGASVSILSETTFRQLWKRQEAPGLRHPHVTLKKYTGEPLAVLGQMDVWVKCEGSSAKVPVLIVKGCGPNLLGRDWLRRFKLDWRKILNIQATEGDHRQIVERYAEIFREELGTLRGTKATLQVDPLAKPKYFKARPVPYALKEKIERELERLEEEGTIEPVQFAKWAAPIVLYSSQMGRYAFVGIIG